MRVTTLMLAFTLAAAAPALHAQTYRWVDEHGVTTLSSELPPSLDAVRELSVVDEGGLSQFEKRSLEIINEENRRARANRRAALPPELGLPGSVPDSQQQTTRRRVSETVRDPCLLSSDPRCIEKNAHNYDPYLGYAPSALAGMATTSGAALAATSASVSESAHASVAGR